MGGLLSPLVLHFQLQHYTSFSRSWLLWWLEAAIKIYGLCGAALAGPDIYCWAQWEKRVVPHAKPLHLKKWKHMFLMWWNAWCSFQGPSQPSLIAITVGAPLPASALHLLQQILAPLVIGSGDQDLRPVWRCFSWPWHLLLGAMRKKSCAACEAFALEEVEAHLNIFLSVVAIRHFLLRLLSYPQHRYAQVERLAFGYR